MSWNGVKKQSLKSEIEAWCDEMGIENYIINSKGEIDVDGCVNLDGRDIKELPYKFGKVKGYFSLDGCENLISIKNCPNEIYGYFSIEYCTNFECITNVHIKRILGTFYCKHNKNEVTLNQVEYLCNKISGQIIIR